MATRQGNKRSRSDDQENEQHAAKRIKLSQPIPSEMVQQICKFVNPKTLHACMQVNHMFFEALQGDQFWFMFYHAYFQVPNFGKQAKHLYRAMFVERFVKFGKLYRLPMVQQLYDAKQNGQHILQWNHANWEMTMKMLQQMQNQAELSNYQIKLMQNARLILQNPNGFAQWKAFALQPHNVMMSRVQRYPYYSGSIVYFNEYDITLYDLEGIPHKLHLFFSSDQTFAISLDSVQIVASAAYEPLLVNLAKMYKIPASTSFVDVCWFLHHLLDLDGFNLEEQISITSMPEERQLK